MIDGSKKHNQRRLGKFMLLKGAVSQWMKHLCMTIQMKAIQQYFHVILCSMFYKVVITVKCV